MLALQQQNAQLLADAKRAKVHLREREVDEVKSVSTLNKPKKLGSVLSKQKVGVRFHGDFYYVLVLSDWCIYIYV